MKEQNKNRLALIDARFGKRAALGGEMEGFEAAFQRVRDAVLLPVMDDVAAELLRLGHAPWIGLDDLDHEGDACRPCIALHLGIGGIREAPGFIAFGVSRSGGAPDVLAWLVAADTPFDLRRYARPEHIEKDHVEQLLIDAVEQIFSRGAR